MKDDAMTVAYNAYTADCLGMITRCLYQSTDLPLYTEMVSLVKKPAETTESIKEKILRLLTS